jgi:hypothetical protein
MSVAIVDEAIDLFLCVLRKSPTVSNLLSLLTPIHATNHFSTRNSLLLKVLDLSFNHHSLPIADSLLKPTTGVTLAPRAIMCNVVGENIAVYAEVIPAVSTLVPPAFAGTLWLSLRPCSVLFHL